ncbi:hypothetical protein AAIR98_000128 [Elusimicrobium simillimum]|uniref:hypothetical protein n=1 Tax=Elusimicrobium simillimum TaxID=3143438 RepID=UPI003C6FFE06
MKQLTPLRNKPQNYEPLKDTLEAIFLEVIYAPIIKIVKDGLGVDVKVLKNAKAGLVQAIESGSVQYADGWFKGSFNSAISRELKALGAKWSNNRRGFFLRYGDLPFCNSCHRP